MVKVLFVCTGNICRSPTAEGILRHTITKHKLENTIQTDSAGLHDFHVGEAPDPRSQSIARQRGVSMSALRARQFCLDDYNLYDLILAMDSSHLSALRKNKPHNSKAEVELFLEYVESEHAREVPDPYYGDEGDFEFVFDLIDEGVQALVKKIGVTS